MLLSVLDDSDSGKIRRSIIIASFAFLTTINYKLQINIPDIFFSGDGGFSTINNNAIVNGLIIIQSYLLIKLGVSWNSELAIFEREWILDNYEGDNDLSKAKTDIDRFLSFCEKYEINEKLINQSDIDRLSDLSDKCENLGIILNEANIQESKIEIITEGRAEFARTIAKLTNQLRKIIERLPNDIKSELINAQETINSTITEANKLSDTEKSKLENLIGDYKNKLEGINSVINNLVDIQEEYREVSQIASNQLIALKEKLAQIENFTESYPSSKFYDAINLSENHLRKGKKSKYLELWIFNLITPLFLGFLSIGYGLFSKCQ